MFCAPFFHFYAHDQTGPIGEQLRFIMAPLQALIPGLEDDRTFAMAFVSLFMQVTGILQLPAFLGPSFSPFIAIKDMIINGPLNLVLPGNGSNTYKKGRNIDNDFEKDIQAPAPSKGNKNKPKRKKGKSKKA